MADRVRAHTRRTPGGGTTRVQQHSRRSRPRQGLVSPGHAWQLMKRAHRAGRRRKKALAFTLLTLGVTEFTAWLTLDTLGLLFTTAGVLMIGAGAGTGALTGRGAPKSATGGETRAFARGQRASGKAAEAYAQRKRDQAVTRRAAAQRRAAAKKKKPPAGKAGR